MGVNADTGIAGLTLGGGFGKLGRKHGLSCDNLLAAEIVTAGRSTVESQRHRERGPFLGHTRRRRQFRNCHQFRFQAVSCWSSASGRIRTARLQQRTRSDALLPCVCKHGSGRVEFGCSARDCAVGRALLQHLSLLRRSDRRRRAELSNPCETMVCRLKTGLLRLHIYKSSRCRQHLSARAPILLEGAIHARNYRRGD